MSERIFYSHFADGGNVLKITAAQYITEYLCTIVAKRENKNLSDRFWQKEPWKKFFRMQIVAANALLKTYPVDVILDALRDKKCYKIQSLRAEWLLGPLLEEYMAKYKAEQEVATTTEKISTNKTRRQNPNNKSLFGKLKGL